MSQEKIVVTPRSNMPESFSIEDVGETIAKMLGLREGASIEIQRDRLNPNRLMIIRLDQEKA